MPLIGIKVNRLSMKKTIYLDYIISGDKKFEGRVFSTICKGMQVGDHLELCDSSAGWGIVCEISSLSKNTSFMEMLQAKGVLSLLPNLYDENCDQSTFLSRGLEIYESFPGSSRSHILGVVAIGLNFLKKFRFFICTRYYLSPHSYLLYL